MLKVLNGTGEGFYMLEGIKMMVEGKCYPPIRPYLIQFSWPY
jgi:hypothetical protein